MTTFRNGAASLGIFRNAVRMLIAGWLFDGNDVLDVPQLLRDIAADYEEEIKQHVD